MTPSISEETSDRVERCRRFIRERMVFRKTINTTCTSYGLKHSVEEWYRQQGLGDPYVSNSDFILAAQLEGAALKPCLGTPNFYFNLSHKKDAA